MSQGRTLDVETFRTKFDAAVAKDSLSWEAVGFLSPDRGVYPFGTDTKVISTVFEAIAAPVIAAIAEEAGYEVEGAGQTIYPDFTLTPPGRSEGRIAIDVKTTYRRFSATGKPSQFRYTLGSYTSFLRDPAQRKNIKYPYSQYAAHWVLGFLYTRRRDVSAKQLGEPVRVEDSAGLECPYEDVDYFVQEKFKIAGLLPASGNTTNIGSISATDLEPFKDGTGPFATLGPKVCDDYWRHLPKRAADRLYSTVESFLAWRSVQPVVEAEYDAQDDGEAAV